MNAKRLIPIAIVMAIIIIGLAMWKVDFFEKMFAKKVNSSEDLVKLTENLKLELEALNKNDHALGNPTASVQIIEYADTTCTHCAEMQNILHDVLNEHVISGDVVWVYRNFLSDTENNKEVRYLECVSKVSGNQVYWDYLNTLFDTPLANKTEAFLLAEAKKLKVSESLLNGCLESDYPEKRIETDMTKAIAAGVIGTPYLFIIKPNGEIKQIVGLVPKVTVEATLSEALSE